MNVFALCIHLTTFLLGALTGYFVGSFSGACLTAANLNSAVFRAVYLCVRSSQGRLRWFEYAITAGLVAIAVLHLRSRIRVDWIVLVSCSVFARQSLGFLLNSHREAFLPARFAWVLLLVGEIVFTGIASRTATFWTYVVFSFLAAWFLRVGELYAQTGTATTVSVFFVLYLSMSGVGLAWLAVIAVACVFTLLVHSVGISNRRITKRRAYQRKTGVLLWSGSV